MQSVTPGGPRFPRNASRFEVLRAADSTVVFARMEAEWVAPGMVGIAVDPAHRDVLVARLEVLSVEGPMATALITGQTTMVDSAHVVLLLPPVQPMWRNKMFLRGVATGAIGVIAAVIVF